MAFGSYAGELTAVGALLCWAFGSQCFEAAGHRVGSMAVNLLRLFLSFLMFCVFLTWRDGLPIPVDFPLAAWGWLVLSGVIGFSLGDMCLFRAFVEIGPRLAMLLLALNAPMSAILGWLLLGEEYTAVQWLGIVVTLIGVGWVICERPDPSQLSGTPYRVRELHLRGILLGVGAAAGQAIGGVMTKHGMGDLDAFAATQIRVIGGIVGLAILYCLLRWWRQTFRALGDKRAVAWMTGGAFLGSFLGVALYLRAMQLTTIGVVATILALLPVVMIPLAVIIHKEHVSPRAMVGALIAFVGVMLLVSA